MTLRRTAKDAVASLLAKGNLELTRSRPGDLEAAFWEVHDQVRFASMTSTARMYGLWSALRHVHARGIKGDVVECGVWKGGSAMLAALTLQQLDDRERTLWLYDTFEGMSEPAAVDGQRADRLFRAGRKDVAFAYAAIDEVRSNMASTGWPDDRTRLVQGKVENTIPGTLPDGPIGLLRLDTDWYESTRHELQHLYPRLAAGGVLIIDDYGYWEGARRAVDEWVAALDDPPLLVRLDDTGRVAIKPGR